MTWARLLRRSRPTFCELTRPLVRYARRVAEARCSFLPEPFDGRPDARVRAGAFWPLESIVQKVLRWLDIAVYLVFLAFALASGPRVTPWYVGLCLVAASVPLWFLARWQLGRSFSVRPEARQLVTTGLYSKIRHPVYVFGGLAWLGALLALLGWSALIIGAIVALVEVGRARREDRVLAEAFGPDYEAYRKRTWF